MPELPEVETVRQTLKNFILDEYIESVEVLYPKIIDGDHNEFIQKVTHSTFKDIKRYGKYLIFVLDHCLFLSHLRMEGKYNIVDSSLEVSKHTHVIFHLSNHKDLRYIDTRKFGRMKIVGEDYLYQSPLNKLGKEPFDISEDELYEKLHHSSLSIKTALLDQSIMCGIGNIYANEICFAMKIHPHTRVNRLSKKRIKQLKEVSIDILNHAISQGGTTIHSFDANGIHGLFQIQLNVHHQKTCPLCQGLIT